MVNLSVIAGCRNCPIRYNAVCSECEPEELAILDRAKSYRTFPAGTPLAEAGAPLDHFSSLVTGAATMSRTLEDGRRQTVGLLLPSDFIGRPGRATSPFDVTAVAEVTLCRFGRAEFERIVRSTPHIAVRLLSKTLDELDAAREWAVVLGRMKARERVAAFLVRIARRQRSLSPHRQPPREVTLHLPLSREALADYLGLTIETTSRQITALRKDGLIGLQRPREIDIPDFAALAREAGEAGEGRPVA